MKLGRLMEILKGYSTEHRLYDTENPEFYVSDVQYCGKEDKLYLDFSEEKEEGVSL